MDINRSQIASDRTVSSSRDMVVTNHSRHVRFDEIEQTQPVQGVHDKSSEDVAGKQAVQPKEKASQNDIHDTSDSAKFFAVKMDNSQETEADHRRHVKMMRERVNQSYATNDNAAKTEAVLRDIHKYQEKTQQNNHDVAGKAIDLLA